MSPVIDEVSELMEKYSNTTKIIWLGDLNGSLAQERRYKRDLLLQEFCSANGLESLDDCSEATFYMNNQLIPTSRIDHILQLKYQIQLLNCKTCIDVRNPINTSPHNPISVEFQTTFTLQDKRGREDVTKHSSSIGNGVKPRINWDKVDADKYYDLTELHISLVNKYAGADASPELLLDRLNDLLYSLSQQCLAKKQIAKSRKQPRKQSYDYKLIPLIKYSKQCFYLWKCSGRPVDENDETLTNLKRSKKQLRSMQRRLKAERHMEEQTQLMEASEYNPTVMHKLIQKQRRTSNISTDVIFNGERFGGVDLTNEWGKYFQTLATPVNRSEFVGNYKQSSQIRNIILQSVNENEDFDQNLSDRLDVTLVEKLLSSMKNGKSPDLYGISSEHLKMAHPNLVPIITSILKKIVDRRCIPDQLKCGIITPVYKNKGSKSSPDNYRRITVTSVIGKLLEKFLVLPTKEILQNQLNKQQRFFCKSSSSLNTAFILSEAIANAKDVRSPLYVMFLDASKAFDVVWHDSLLNKIHDLNINGDLWLLYRSLYQEVSSRVKCNGVLSSSIKEEQGVRQGGIPSTELFKARCDKLLCMVEGSNSGYKIGSIDCSIPTCADDTALVAAKIQDLQTLINIAEFDSNRERYKFSSSKSVAMTFSNKRAGRELPCDILTLEGKSVHSSNKETHLGIIRTPDGNATCTVENNISKARKSWYSMMGAGLQGLGGLHPDVSTKIWNAYVVPRLTYGLEVMNLNETHYSSLEIFQRLSLRYIQHLPPGTASAAVILLLGVRPIQCIIERNILTFFANLCRLDNSKEKKILLRQACVSNSSASGFTQRVKALLCKYDLPSIYTLLSRVPSKRIWKQLVSNAVDTYWLTDLCEKAKYKSTLNYLNIQGCTFGRSHNLWSMTPMLHREILKSSVKVKLLLGQYQLESVAAKRGTTSSKVCTLCKLEDETQLHFVLRCPAYRSVRDPIITEILEIIDQESININKQDDEELMKLLMDSSFYNIPMCVSITIESLSRKLVYTLHSARAKFCSAFNLQTTSQATQNTSTDGAPNNRRELQRIE